MTIYFLTIVLSVSKKKQKFERLGLSLNLFALFWFAFLLYCLLFLEENNNTLQSGITFNCKF